MSQVQNEREKVNRRGFIKGISSWLGALGILLGMSAIPDGDVRSNSTLHPKGKLTNSAVAQECC